MNLFNLIQYDNIEFHCLAEDWKVIPEPYPAKKFIPEWYKAIPPKIGSKGLKSSTVKRCMPFLDAMSVGYIIPLCADIEIKTSSDCSVVKWSTNFYKSVIETHTIQQINSEKVPNPHNPKQPLKWMNYWYIKVPKDYSLLFMPPLNRPEERFTCFSGFVDGPYPDMEYINFPFVFNEGNFTGVLKAGIPLIQVIPIKKSNLIQNGIARVSTEKEIENSKWVRRKRMSQESYYKDTLHVKMK